MKNYLTQHAWKLLVGLAVGLVIGFAIGEVIFS